MPKDNELTREPIHGKDKEKQMTADEAQELRRRKNREAAKKCREKRRKKEIAVLQELEDGKKELEKQIKHLEENVAEMTEQRAQWAEKEKSYIIILNRVRDEYKRQKDRIHQLETLLSSFSLRNSMEPAGSQSNRLLLGAPPMQQQPAYFSSFQHQPLQQQQSTFLSPNFSTLPVQPCKWDEQNFFDSMSKEDSPIEASCTDKEGDECILDVDYKDFFNE
jgi:hypothetical protein